MDDHIPDFFERFFERYTEEPMSGCWLWHASQTTSGYGNLTFKRRTYYAHRASYEATHGAGTAAGLIVRHRCDNPCCINPDHLVIGTHKDNSNDAWSRGRMHPARGEQASKAKLTDADVLKLRAMARDGACIREITRKFPIGWTAAFNAVVGATWGHLPGALAADQVHREACRPPLAQGEASPTSILKLKDVLEIKQQLANGGSGRALARRYGVSASTISAIKHGRIWAHVR